MGEKEKHEERKKVVIRFLKECGFYHQFLKYLKTEKGSRTYKWYEKKTIDSILGELNFTEYLSVYGEFRMNTFLTAFFRTYLKKIYGNKYKLRDTPYIKFADEYGYTIDKETGNIDIQRLRRT